MQAHALNLITLQFALGLCLLPSMARTYIGETLTPQLGLEYQVNHDFKYPNILYIYPNVSTEEETLTLLQVNIWIATSET